MYQSIRFIELTVTNLYKPRSFKLQLLQTLTMNSMLYVVIALLLPMAMLGKFRVRIHNYILLFMFDFHFIDLLTLQVKCGQNEAYQKCGTACPATCNDLTYPLPKPPKACILSCKSGCFCKEGFYRSANGKCVPPQQCCGRNEVYQTCGSACVETCQVNPTFCTKQCVAGCFCTCSDYVRRDNSTGSPCILREKCPQKCDD